jgi:hypothetical protein
MLQKCQLGQLLPDHRRPGRQGPRRTNSATDATASQADRDQQPLAFRSPGWDGGQRAGADQPGDGGAAQRQVQGEPRCGGATGRRCAISATLEAFQPGAISAREGGSCTAWTGAGSARR